jgi:hypothetical protein
MNSDNNSQLTSVLCIPHVFIDVTVDQVRKAFRKQNLGDILSVCMIDKISKNKEKYNTANITIRWFDNPQSIAARQLLSEGSEIRVYYKGPWYWNVYNYDTKKRYVSREADAGLETLIAPTLALTIAEANNNLNPNAKDFTPSKQLNPSASEYKPNNSNKKITKTVHKAEEKNDVREDEERCKKLLKGVILSGSIGFDNVMRVTEIEISYEGVPPIPPSRPRMRRQISKDI